MIRFFALLLSVAILAISCVDSQSQQTTSRPCHSPFGAIIGSAEVIQNLNIQPSHLNKNFTAKITCESNCNGEYESNENAFIDLVRDVFGGRGGFYDATCDLQTPECPSQIFLGMKWQCVLKGRDALLRKYGATFASVDYAVDIWNLTHVTQYAIVPTKNNNSNTKSCKCTSVKRPFVGFANNATTVPPREGDLIIYDTQGPDMAPTGHVAAIVNVNAEAKYIEIIEDNWSNAPWPNKQQGFSRRIEYEISPSGVQVLKDSPFYILGWKRIE